MDQLIKVDDLDKRTVDGVERIDLGYRGVDFEIDLSEAHRAALDELLRPYLAAARRKQRTNAAQRKPRTPSSARRTTQDQRIRAWAADNGEDLPVRGPLSQEVRDRYERAHPASANQDDAAPLAVPNPYAGAVDDPIQ